MRSLSVYALLLWAGVVPLPSQDGVSSSRVDLSSLAANEARQGVYVFYTQSFIDKENQRASYRGSIYGAIQKLELDDCELKIETLIVDKFSGTVGRAPTGQLQDTYHYSARLLLTPEIVAGAAVVEARPVQLGSKTHSVCDENTSCGFPWLRIQAKSRVIHQISSVNDALDFEGQVDHFVIPISSLAIGRQLIDGLRAVADGQCR